MILNKRSYCLWSHNRHVWPHHRKTHRKVSARRDARDGGPARGAQSWQSGEIHWGWCKFCRCLHQFQWLGDVMFVVCVVLVAIVSSKRCCSRNQRAQSPHITLATQVRTWITVDNRCRDTSRWSLRLVGRARPVQAKGKSVFRVTFIFSCLLELEAPC